MADGSVMIREGFGELAQIRQAVAAVVEAAGEEGVRGLAAISQADGDSLLVIREGLGEPIQLPQDRAAIVQGRREEATKSSPQPFCSTRWVQMPTAFSNAASASSGLPRSLRAVP